MHGLFAAQDYLKIEESNASPAPRWIGLTTGMFSPSAIANSGLKINQVVIRSLLVCL